MSDIDQIKRLLQKNNSADSSFRGAAANLAKNTLATSGSKKVSDGALRRETDKIYGDLGGEQNDVVASGLSMLKDVADAPAWVLGNAADWAFDNILARGVGIFNKDAEDTMKKMFNGEDAQGFADMAIDMGLMALPGGAGIVLGKNAIQNSDLLYEGVTGKDFATGEDLSEEEKNNAGFQGALATGLAAIPAVGAVRASGKAAKAATKGQKVVKPTPEGKTVDDIVRESGNEAAANYEKKVLTDKGKTLEDLTPDELDKFISKQNNKILGARWNARDIYDPNSLGATASDYLAAGKLKDAAKAKINDMGDTVRGIQEAVKGFGRTIDNVKDLNAGELAKYAKNKVGSTRLAHPVDSTRREVNKRLADARIPATTSSSVKSAEAITDPIKLRDLQRNNVASYAVRLAPIGAAIGTNSLSGGDDMSGYGTALAALALGSPRRFKIGPSGKMTRGMIPTSALAASNVIEQNNRYNDVTDGLTYEEMLARFPKEKNNG